MFGHNAGYSTNLFKKLRCLATAFLVFHCAHMPHKLDLLQTVIFGESSLHKGESNCSRNFENSPILRDSPFFHALYRDLFKAKGSTWLYPLPTATLWCADFSQVIFESNFDGDDGGAC